MNPPDVETTEDAAHGYADGNGLCLVRNVRDFVGMTFHLIQQTGGRLYHNNDEVWADSMEETSGATLCDDDVVVVAGERRRFGVIIT